MKKTLLLTLIACGFLSACSSERVSNFPSYKLTIQQGNAIDPQAFKMLQIGLTRNQVQNLLGTPVLRDPFHPERWDYAYTVTHNGIMQEQKNLTVTFKDDVVIDIKGGIPTEAETEAVAQKY